MTQTPAADIVERWPGYTEQSWSERFAELDVRSSAQLNLAARSIEALRAREAELQIIANTAHNDVREYQCKLSALQRKLDEAVKALEPVEREIDRLERSFGFDRPNWQYQTLMLQLGDLLVIRAALASIRGDAE